MASSSSATTKSKGGILFPYSRNKSFRVEIRIKGWKDEKIWIGKINNHEDAQFIADVVYYYLGQPSVHLLNVNFNFPALECTGAAAPLTSREMCSEYVKSIARGPEFESQREEFVKRVKKVAWEVKRVRVERVPQQIRDENGAALMGPPPHEEEDVQADEPMEAEHPNHLPLILASLEPVYRNADGVEAYVPGFDVSVSGSGVRLHSGLTLTDSSSWADSCLCIPEDHVASPHRDGEEFCSVTRVPETETSFDCPSAMENFQENFFAMEDAADD